MPIFRSFKGLILIFILLQLWGKDCLLLMAAIVQFENFARRRKWARTLANQRVGRFCQWMQIADNPATTISTKLRNEAFRWYQESDECRRCLCRCCGGIAPTQTAWPLLRVRSNGQAVCVGAIPPQHLQRHLLHSSLSWYHRNASLAGSDGGCCR